MKKTKVLIGSAIVVFLLVCLLETNIKPLPGTGSIASKGSSIYAMAGEFRTVAANLLWIKADAYHHEFIAKNGNWSENKELLGLFKLIVDLDPHFEEAYASGTYIYIRGYHSPKEALQFLKLGLQNNPKSWDLNRMAALVYAIEFKDYKTALSYAQNSEKLCQDPFDRKIISRLVSTLKTKIRQAKQPTPSHPA